MIRIQHACIWIRVPGVVRAEIERKKELVLEKINSEHPEGLIYKIQYM